MITLKEATAARQRDTTLRQQQRVQNTAWRLEDLMAAPQLSFAPDVTTLPAAMWVLKPKKMRQTCKTMWGDSETLRTNVNNMHNLGWVYENHTDRCPYFDVVFSREETLTGSVVPASTATWMCFGTPGMLDEVKLQMLQRGWVYSGHQEMFPNNYLVSFRRIGAGPETS